MRSTHDGEHSSGGRIGAGGRVASQSITATGDALYASVTARVPAEVAFSTLTVSVSPRSEALAWSPPGFMAGLESGWSALLSAIAGAVTAAGFVLPFAAIALVIMLPIVALAIWLSRRRRASAQGGQQR